MEPDDEWLVRDCLGGAKRAFETLVGRYEKPVYNVALRMVGNREDARDVAQTAFLKAFQGLATYDPQYKFSSWIFRITVNEALRLLEKRRPTEPVDDTWETPDRGPSEVFSGAEATRVVQAALLELPPDQRAVIVLRHFLGCSYGEIAGVVGAPEKTVKSRLFSARERLRELLVDADVH